MADIRTFPRPEGPEFVLDRDRTRRLGFDEAILCAAKSLDQLREILEESEREGRALLLTRLAPDRAEALAGGGVGPLDYDEASRTAYFGEVPEPTVTLHVVVVSAGTSDIPVCREAVRTLRYHGVDAAEVYDVGVAGLWRLVDRLEEIRRYPVVIAVAGMDAALPTVLAGLVPGLVIAVPTSVGYGVAEGGRAALDSILSSCAPGLLTVNIDNGYGAACAALRTVRALQVRQSG